MTSSQCDDHKVKVPHVAGPESPCRAVGCCKAPASKETQLCISLDSTAAGSLRCRTHIVPQVSWRLPMTTACAQTPAPARHPATREQARQQRCSSCAGAGTPRSCMGTRARPGTRPVSGKLARPRTAKRHCGCKAAANSACRHLRCLVTASAPAVGLGVIGSAWKARSLALLRTCVAPSERARYDFKARIVMLARALSSRGGCSGAGGSARARCVVAIARAQSGTRANTPGRRQPAPRPAAGARGL